jgi:hypothetical protein
MKHNSPHATSALALMYSERFLSFEEFFDDGDDDVDRVSSYSCWYGNVMSQSY